VQSVLADIVGDDEGSSSMRLKVGYTDIVSEISTLKRAG
jgi:hypothetical protein